MLRWNHVESGQVQSVLGFLIILLLLALPFARYVRAAMRRVNAVIICFAVLCSFMSISLLERNQEHRLFITPFSIWIIILYVVVQSALLICYVAQNHVVTEKRLRVPSQKLVGFMLIGILVMQGILYVASSANFMALDLPDEPFNASIATNYALNNDLSSQYIGSAYGSPDVVFPRYYWLMGVWLKVVGSTSLTAQRTFPVIIAFVSLAIFIVAMWRLRHTLALTYIHILIAATVLVSLSTFLRTSHNLRMDILLALYGSLMLWGMLSFWQGGEQTKNKYSTKSGSLILMGIAIFCGMESIPTVAMPISITTGIMLIVWWLKQPQKRNNFIYVVVYSAICMIGILAYYLFQFLPDITSSWARYRAFVQNYSSVTGVGTIHLPVDYLINTIGRFNLILSPVELILIVISVISLWRMKVNAERWMLASTGLGFLLMFLLFRLSYSYMVVFAPFVAYAVARVLYQWQRIRSSFMLVSVAALVAIPMFDLLWSIQTRPNQAYLETLDLLTSQFPEGTIIVGEDAFWFNLHEHHTFIGINGIANYMGIKQVDALNALNTLKIDALLCDKGSPQCQPLLDTGYFGTPTEYQISNSQYWIFWHKKDHIFRSN